MTVRDVSRDRKKERVDLQGLDDQQQGVGRTRTTEYDEDFGEQRRMMEGDEKEKRGEERRSERRGDGDVDMKMGGSEAEQVKRWHTHVRLELQRFYLQRHGRRSFIQHSRCCGCITCLYTRYLLYVL